MLDTIEGERTLRSKGNLGREMLILDPTGHTRMTWDPSEEDEVEIARKAFQKMTKKGYSAFHVKNDGSEGKRMKEFDPNAEKMILAPNLQGG